MLNIEAITKSEAESARDEDMREAERRIRAINDALKNDVRVFAVELLGLDARVRNIVLAEFARKNWTVKHESDHRNGGYFRFS
jgi:hypothetical protein